MIGQNLVKNVRKYMGSILAIFGFLLLCILTFGDIGEILTDAYWQNVLSNLTSIGFMTISLSMIQVSIKQGLGEQALQKGLNTTATTDKYTDHKNLIKECNERLVYMPYFLQNYNERNTILKKREFLINNDFKTEESLMKNGSRRMKIKYKRIHVYLTMTRIKWATTDILYNKRGQIITLAEHRSRRLIKGITTSLFFMVGATLLARGLFFESSEVPFIQKLIKLLTYIITISLNSLPIIIKEYEKGAFGVPNELEELNGIWTEFKNWKIPEWIIKEVEEVNNEEPKRNNGGTNLQKQQKTVCNIGKNSTDTMVSTVGIEHIISNNDSPKQS